MDHFVSLDVSVFMKETKNDVYGKAYLDDTLENDQTLG